MEEDVNVVQEQHRHVEGDLVESHTTGVLREPLVTMSVAEEVGDNKENEDFLTDRQGPKEGKVIFQNNRTAA